MDKYRFDDSIVVDKKGKEKQNHTHYLNDEPLMGTSTVLGVLAKPLTWWASGLAVGRMGWLHKDNPMDVRLAAAYKGFQEIEGMVGERDSIDDVANKYLALLDEAYRAHSVKLDTSAQAGTDMHFELEKYVKECIENNNGIPRFIEEHEHKAVEIFSEWAAVHIKKVIASEAYCYSKKLWTGGIVDLVYEDMKGRYALLDFKSAKEAYHSHLLQNAGYDIAISENGILTKDGELVTKLKKKLHHYAVLPFGMPTPKVSTNEDLGRTVAEYKKGFESCVILHKLMDKSKF